MKNLKLILVQVLVISIISVSCKKEVANTEANKSNMAVTDVSNVKIETASFEISGMTCAMGCAKSIENKLAALEGVEKASVDFEKKTASVKYNSILQTPEKLVSFVEAVADGKTYKVSNVKSTADKAMLYQDTPKQEKKKAKKAKKSTTEYSTSTSSATTDAAVAPVAEKKSGCCSAKKACSEKQAVL